MLALVGAAAALPASALESRDAEPQVPKWPPGWAPAVRARDADARVPKWRPGWAPVE